MWRRMGKAIPALLLVSGASLTMGVGGAAQAQETQAHGLPLETTEAQIVGPGGYYGGADVIAARDGEVPEGIEPLSVDIYTTEDFYADRDLWTDPRYFRCSSSVGLEAVHGSAPGTQDLTGSNPPATGPWGYCDRDYPREAIVSPYPFETAQEHYEALLTGAEADGGPTQYSRETPPPDWSGRYIRTHDEIPPWFFMHLNQASTIVSLLTEDYQARFVQQAYHTAVNNAPQWPASYCWPEGLIRFWSGPAFTGVPAVEYPAGTIEFDIIVRPEQVTQIGGIADNFLRQAQVGREFTFEGSVPRLGQDVPRWYGETIAFWDSDTLITWTSNVQAWMNHGGFEFSGDLQVVEVYTPRTDETGEFIGLEHETVFYDQEALVDPVRVVRNLDKVSDLNEGDPFVFVECNPTIFPVEGFPEPISPGTTFEYPLPDWFGRPWAQIVERNFEGDMSGSTTESELFGF